MDEIHCNFAREKDFFLKKKGICLPGFQWRSQDWGGVKVRVQRLIENYDGDLYAYGIIQLIMRNILK